jgi:hypothetical protein
MTPPTKAPNSRLPSVIMSYGQHGDQATIDWSNSLSSIRHRACCLPQHQQDLFWILKNKLHRPYEYYFTDIWQKYTRTIGYDQTASILARSDYVLAFDFLNCGCKGFSCGNRFLCPRCCFGKYGGRLADEFGHAIADDRMVHYIVLSLSRDPNEERRLKVGNFESTDRDRLRGASLAEKLLANEYGLPFDSSEDIDHCIRLWRIFAEVIDDMTGNAHCSRFSAAVGGPELAVHFSAFRVLPHYNLVVWSPDFSEDIARELRSRIRTKMRNSRVFRRFEESIFPVVACFRLRTSDDLGHVLKYSMKPIAIADAYTAAADRGDREDKYMKELNSDVKTFFQNLPVVFAGTRRIERFGACHSQNKFYLGVWSEHQFNQRTKRREARKSRPPQTRSGNKRRNTKTKGYQWSRFEFYEKWWEKSCVVGKIIPPTKVRLRRPKPDLPKAGGGQSDCRN